MLQRVISSKKEDDENPSDSENPLDGCLHVFLDLGSNRGLQIRKLYEPHLFPLAPILPLYEKYAMPQIPSNIFIRNQTYFWLRN